jgi:hypothetical protein
MSNLVRSFQTSGSGVALVVTVPQARDSFSNEHLHWKRIYNYIPLSANDATLILSKTAPYPKLLVLQAPFSTLNLMLTPEANLFDGPRRCVTLLREERFWVRLSAEWGLEISWPPHGLRPDCLTLVACTLWCSAHPSSPRTSRRSTSAEGHCAVLTTR